MAYTSSPYEPMGPGLSHLAAGDATDLRTSEWYRGSQAGYPETGYATGSHDDPGPDGHYGYPHSWRLGQWSEGGTHPDSSSLDTSTFEGAGATGSEEGEEESDDEEVDPLIGMDAEGIPFFDISEQEAEERRMGRSLRQRWLNFVEMSTFFVSDRWIKSNLPGCLGPKATREQLLAWREKLTMFDILLGGYIIVAVVFLALPIVFCTQKPGEKTGLLSKDVWYCWTYDIFVLFYTVMSAIVVIFTLYAAIRIRFQTEKKRPDQSDSLVLLHIPCYSEDEQVLRKTIDSVVATDFPDSGKLLWVIADGLVTGRGANKSTPEVLVEDIFHCRSEPGFREPLPKTYLSAGHSGAKMNAAKTYSGMFTVQGHTCPYIVSVKCGMPDEINAAKPGNRGKRDSQIIIYSFLYNYNFDRENMSELDHEIAKCMFELGIDPADLDYMLLTDADSYVRPNALDLLVNYLDGDPTSIGACGETKVDNKLTSFICSIQTFEYFITHVVLKAFEGYYSKVLVLSGCFALYRIKIRDEDGVETPGIISPHIIEKYIGNKHKTLHEHNLLSIGEDRYLSTVIIRSFPEYDTVYVPSAICTTSVPDTFGVLLSQRRRWTNSLVHCHYDHMMYPPPFKSKWMSFYFYLVLLLELWMVFMLPLLLTCGFLFLFYFAVIGFGTSGLILTVVLFFVPGFVVSFTGRWHQFFYWIPFIMGTPIFSILIPVYSMWKMDEFGWGTSRETENKKQSPEEIALVSANAEETSLQIAESLEDEIPGDGRLLPETGPNGLAFSSRAMSPTPDAVALAALEYERAAARLARLTGEVPAVSFEDQGDYSTGADSVYGMEPAPPLPQLLASEYQQGQSEHDRQQLADAYERALARLASLPHTAH